MIEEYLNKLIADKRIVDLYVLARYFYRIGNPIIDDAVYDHLEHTLQINNVVSAIPYLNRSYDDDPIPEKLLQEMNVAPATFLLKENVTDLATTLNDEKSLSIHSVTDTRAAYSFFMELRRNHLDFVASLKVDGVNTKMLYTNGELCLSLSRGRNDGSSFDYMEGSSKVMPLKITTYDGIHHLKITGESYVDREALPFLREKYNTEKYKTSKSSAISMLRTRHAREDYKHLHTLVFYADVSSSTIMDMFFQMKQYGFETVPHVLHSWNEIPERFDDFSKWLPENVMYPIWNMGKTLPSDGCVIEVNDLSWTGDINGQYSTRQLALKFGPWKFKIYKGTITNIRLEQRRVYKSVRIEIQPIITDDDCKAQVINSFNPAILIDNDLEVGKEIYFEKNAEAVNILIHGKRLISLSNDMKHAMDGETCD